MTLYSAVDDFALKTLASVPGVLGKLRYVSGLRRADGSYQHWGLGRTFGERPACEAIESQHRELMLKVLRMPLKDVLEDAIVSASAEQVSVADYMAALRENADKLVPADVAGGSVGHFRSILQALGSLALSCRVANRQAS
jgi:hypothetical protein